MKAKIALAGRELERDRDGFTRVRVGDGGAGVPPREGERWRRCSSAVATLPLVIFDLLRSVIDSALAFAGADVATPVVAGIAGLLVGLHYSRELSGLLVSIARFVSISSVVLFGVGVAVLVGVATGWISIDGGIAGDVLRGVGELLGFGGSH